MFPWIKNLVLLSLRLGSTPKFIRIWIPRTPDAFYNVGRYNAVFFLLGKLENGDEIDIFYNNERYKYQVINKKVVNPEAVAEYLRENSGQQTLTLQTCYPPGTTLRRLIVVAKKI